MKNIFQIYTDGSSLGNPGLGGWGVVIVSDKKIIKELGGYKKNTTNNQMELNAAIEALKYSNNNSRMKEVDIYTDSAYLIGGVTTWILVWEKNGWRTAKKDPVLNQDLWKELISEVRKSNAKIKWNKVKGHSGDLYNDRADYIATECANLQKKYIF